MSDFGFDEKKKGNVVGNDKMGAGCCGCLLAPFLLVVLLHLWSTIFGPAPSNNNRPSSSTVSGTGDVAVLNNGAGISLVATTSSAFDELNRAAAKGDKEYLGELLQAGKVIPVESGTKVRILEVHFASRKIRVIEGPKTGVEGYVPYEFIK